MIRMVKYGAFIVALIVLPYGCGRSDAQSERFDQQSYHSESVHFRNEEDGAELAGTLSLPLTDNKIPAVALRTGSGLQDRNESVYGQKPYAVLADYLTRNGIAVLRYDDRGFGASRGPLINVTPEDFAADVYAGVQYLKLRDEIIADEIGLIGHSMGAVEGSILASRHDDIAFLVMLAGPGLPLDINMLIADSVNNIRSGNSIASVEAGQNLLRQMIAVVKSDEPINNREERLSALISDWLTSLPEPVKGPVEAFTKRQPDHWRKMASEWSTPYFRYVLDYDPFPVLSNITCPVLSLIGEKDVQVLPEKNSRRVEEALSSGTCKQYRVEIVDGVNHLFQKADTGVISEYARIKESFDPETMAMIVTWIGQQARH